MRRCQVAFALFIVFGVLDSRAAAWFSLGRGTSAEQKTDENGDSAQSGQETTTDFFEGRIAHHTDIPYIRPLQQVDNNIPPIQEVGENRIDDSASHSKAEEGHSPSERNRTALEQRSDASDAPDVEAPEHPEFTYTDEEYDENCTTTELPEDGVQLEARQLGYGRSSTALYPSYPVPPGAYVPATYGYRPFYRPLVPEVKLFLCTFENHACGFRNQENIPYHFRRASNFLANRGGHYMVVNAQEVGRSVSRLITPYLPGYPGARACVSFSFLIQGPCAGRIELLSQASETKRLLTFHRDSLRWDDNEYDFDAPQDVRFFIEAYTTDRGPGVIAIDNFKYYFGPCDRRGLASATYTS